MERLKVFLFILSLVGLIFWQLHESTHRVITTPVASTFVVTPTPTPQPFSEDKLWSLIQKWRTDNGFSLI